MATAVATKAAPPHQKIKRPPPVQTTVNGVRSSQSSPSPSVSSQRPPSGFKHPTNATVINGINGTVNGGVQRSSNRRRDSHKPTDLHGRLIRTGKNGQGENVQDRRSQKRKPEPYIKTPGYILRKYRNAVPSLTIHLHPTHFRFEQQDGSFSYNSPMRAILEHIKSSTVPHDMIEEFSAAGVKFYEGCLIVQVQDHKSASLTSSTAANGSTTDKNIPFSIHNYNLQLTPSPYVPYPQLKLPDIKSKDVNNVTAGGPNDVSAKPEASKGPKIFTAVLFPTPLSLQEELFIYSNTPDPRSNNRKQSQAGLARAPASATMPHPLTPSSAVPPTPTTTGHPAKRQRMLFAENDIPEFESVTINSTAPPLFLEPAESFRHSQTILDRLTDTLHQIDPPLPKTRKRTVAELAADEELAAREQRFMLIMDERLGSSLSASVGGKSSAVDGETGAVSFEPRFERFKTLEAIQAAHREEAQREAQREMEAKLQRDNNKAKQDRHEQEVARLAQDQNQLNDRREEVRKLQAQSLAVQGAQAQAIPQAQAETPSPVQAQDQVRNQSQIQHGPNQQIQPQQAQAPQPQSQQSRAQQTQIQQNKNQAQAQVQAEAQSRQLQAQPQPQPQPQQGQAQPNQTQQTQQTQQTKTQAAQVPAQAQGQIEAQALRAQQQQQAVQAQVQPQAQAQVQVDAQTQRAQQQQKVAQANAQAQAEARAQQQQQAAQAQAQAQAHVKAEVQAQRAQQQQVDQAKAQAEALSQRVQQQQLAQAQAPAQAQAQAQAHVQAQAQAQAQAQVEAQAHRTQAQVQAQAQAQAQVEAQAHRAQAQVQAEAQAQVRQVQVQRVQQARAQAQLQAHQAHQAQVLAQAQHNQGMVAIQQQQQRTVGQNQIPHVPITNGVIANNPQNIIPVSQSHQQSPVVHKGTPQSNSSPLSGNTMLSHTHQSVPMKVTSSNQGHNSSPGRPSSAIQPGGVPMITQRSQRSQQPTSRRGTPQVTNGTPNLQQSTPVLNQAMPTPRIAHSSPPITMASAPAASQNVLTPQYAAQYHQFIQQQQQQQQQQRTQLFQQQQQQQQFQNSPPTPQILSDRSQLSQQLYQQQLQQHHQSMTNQTANNISLPHQMANSPPPSQQPQQRGNGAIPQDQMIPYARQMQRHLFNRIMTNLQMQHQGRQIAPDLVLQAENTARQRAHNWLNNANRQFQAQQLAQAQAQVQAQHNRQQQMANLAQIPNGAMNGMGAVQ